MKDHESFIHRIPVRQIALPILIVLALMAVPAIASPVSPSADNALTDASDTVKSPAVQAGDLAVANSKQHRNSNKALVVTPSGKTRMSFKEVQKSFETFLRHQAAVLQPPCTNRGKKQIRSRIWTPLTVVKGPGWGEAWYNNFASAVEGRRHNPGQPWWDQELNKFFVPRGESITFYFAAVVAVQYRNMASCEDRAWAEFKARKLPERGLWAYEDEDIGDWDP